MENTMNLQKKMNTYLHYHQSQHRKQGSNESLAKQRLFQVSQFETPACLQLRPANIDVWNERQNKSAQEAIKPLKFLRRTVHFRPSVQSKFLMNKTYQDYQNIEESIIPKLKNILKKLQSPEKQAKNIEKRTLKRNVQAITRQNSCLQQKSIRRNDIVLLQNVFENKRISIRTKNISSQKKSAKLLHTNHQESPMRKVLSKQRGINVRQFADQIPLIREARKRRTLKNLLF